MFLPRRLPNIFAPFDSRSDGSMRAAPRSAIRRAGGARLDVDAQEAAFDGAVPDGVDAVGSQAQLEAEIRGAREDDGLPAFEALLEYFAELSVELTGLLVVLQAHAVRRVHAHQAHRRSVRRLLVRALRLLPAPFAGARLPHSVLPVDATAAWPSRWRRIGATFADPRVVDARHRLPLRWTTRPSRARQRRFGERLHREAHDFIDLGALRVGARRADGGRCRGLGHAPLK